MPRVDVARDEEKQQEATFTMSYMSQMRAFLVAEEILKIVNQSIDRKDIILRHCSAGTSEETWDFSRNITNEQLKEVKSKINNILISVSEQLGVQAQLQEEQFGAKHPRVMVYSHPTGSKDFPTTSPSVNEAPTEPEKPTLPSAKI